MDEFNKLKQRGTIHEYQLKFEELKSLMLHMNPYLKEKYFVLSFISELSDNLRSMVKMMRPRSLQEVVEDTFDKEHQPLEYQCKGLTRFSKTFLKNQ